MPWPRLNRPVPRVRSATTSGTMTAKTAAVTPSSSCTKTISDGLVTNASRRPRIGSAAKPINNNGMFANGWEPVPASRHDGVYMEKGHDGPIIVDQMMLVERRVELTLEARAEEIAAAKGLLRTQNEQFQPRMPGARAHQETRLRARRTIERMPGDIGRPDLQVDDGVEVYTN